jgi:hypothetical protein
MQAQQRGGLEDDCVTDQPARTYEEYAQAGDHAVRQAEIGGPFPGPIEDQQLVLDEHGFGNDGTRAARTGESGEGHQQMQE